MVALGISSTMVANLGVQHVELRAYTYPNHPFVMCKTRLFSRSTLMSFVTLVWRNSQVSFEWVGPKFTHRFILQVSSVLWG